MNIGNIVGIAIGTKLVNGKFKPKYGTSAIITTMIFLLAVIGFFILFVIGIINLNIEYIIFPGLGVIGFGYVFLTLPYTQNANNYYIEFQNEQSLNGFRLYYKKKLVNVKYILGKDGKIAFYDNKNKLNCISYADGSKMNNFVKTKIINYFSKWLHDYDLLSNEVTTSLE